MFNQPHQQLRALHGVKGGTRSFLKIGRSLQGAAVKMGKAHSDDADGKKMANNS
jgi:hypothetical protein